MSNALSKVREIFYKWTGISVYRSLPRGVNVFQDLRSALPNFRAKTVFDVGANVGQSIDEFIVAFGDATIYSFEPVASNMSELERRFSKSARVRLFKYALSNSTGNARIRTDLPSVQSKLSDSEAGELIELETLDRFCETNQISSIDFLKIDTEGHDLAVLEGSRAMLAAQKIGIVQVEAGMNPENNFHCRFEDLKSFMELQSYRLFGLYEQAREFTTGNPKLRRTNPVFISPAIMDSNMRKK